MHPARKDTILLIPVVLALSATSCSDDTNPAQAEAVQTTVPRPSCPNSHGGQCLGALDAGEYTTVELQPTLTYSVADGWSNMEDLRGNFLLLPPGATLDGVDLGTSDYIGVYTSVRAPLGCEERLDPSVAPTASAYVGWLQHQPSLTVSEPRPITVGGLTGLEVDVSLTADPACSDRSLAFTSVLVGMAPSSLSHAVGADYPLRLDLLDRPNKRLLAIELADAPQGGSNFDDWWSAASEVVKTFEFET